MPESIDRQKFSIKIYRGPERVGRVLFEIGIRAMEGEVTSTVEDPELRKVLRRALGTQRRWRWKDLTRKLIDHLSLSTGGRFVLRFGTTPSEEGRGSASHGLRRAIDQAVNE
ncbi:MAG: hypothetical protein ACE5JI_09600 [Acidobacteriota bacterium]